MNLEARTIPMTNEYIESGLKKLADEGIVTLKDVGVLVNGIHRLGTVKKYKDILTEKLAKEFFIIETATWWKLHRDKYDLLSTVDLPEDMQVNLSRIISKITKKDDIVVRGCWLSRDLIYQLGVLHSHLNDLLDFEGDTLVVTMPVCPKQLLTHEINSIFKKRLIH